MLRTLITLLLAVLAACDQQAMLEKFASAQDQTFAKAQIQSLKARDFANIERLADSSISGPGLRGTLEQMAALIPAGEPQSVKLVGAHTAKTPDQTSKNLTYEYEYPGKWLLINVATRNNASGVAIIGFRVLPQDQSLKDQHRFRLSGKSAAQYIVLVLAVVVPLLTLYALVRCVRTPFKGRKWPSVLFILLGVGQIAVNWSTGEWEVSALRIQLFGAGISAPLYGPWTIAVSIPLGAVWFLMRRSKLRVQEGGS